MPSALPARRQDPRAQSTGAIHGRNYRAINHAQSTTRNQLRNCRRCSCLHITPALKSHESFDSAIQITMVWASGKRRSNRSAAGVRAHLEHQNYTFCQDFFGPPNASFPSPPGRPQGWPRAARALLAS